MDIINFLEENGLNITEENKRLVRVELEKVAERIRMIARQEIRNKEYERLRK